VLQVAGTLWASAWVGSFLSLWWAVVVAYLGAFTVPVTYQALRPSLEAAAKKIRAQTIVSAVYTSVVQQQLLWFCCCGWEAAVWAQQQRQQQTAPCVPDEAPV
jgi:hypothetical protein